MADLTFSYNGQQFDSVNGSVTKTLDTAGKYLEGDITVTYDKSAATSGTASAIRILSGYTAYVNGSKVTGTIQSKSAQTYTPTTSNQTIAAGKYLSGTQTIKGDANLIPANIAEGVSIFGVTGTHSGGDSGTFTLSFSGMYAPLLWYQSADGTINSSSIEPGTAGSIEVKANSVVISTRVPSGSNPTTIVSISRNTYYAFVMDKNYSI